MKCSFCDRILTNAGAFVLHETRCKSNPNRVPGVRSPNAGAKKGSVPYNKGRTFPEEILKRTIQLIESDEYLKLHEVTIRSHVKRYLIHKNGHRCSICNTELWNGKEIPLVCDHIDGDSTNNLLDNFRIICCNCDAQLPTFKSKNKNGRKYDREYRNKKYNGE
jgi:hypothetical protein